MLKSTEWPIKDLSPDHVEKIAEIEKILRSIPDEEKERVIDTLQQLRMEICSSDIDEITKGSRETDRARLILSVAKQIEKSLRGKRTIIQRLFTSEQIALLTLKNEIIADSVSEHAKTGMDILSKETLWRDAPIYSILNLEISKEASKKTVENLIGTVRKYGLEQVLSIGEAGKMLKAPPIEQRHEFLRTRGSKMPETVMDQKIEDFLSYIQPIVSNRTMGLNILSSYNINEAIQALGPQAYYFEREIMEIKETAHDLARVIRRRGVDHPITRSMTEGFNKEKRERKFLEQNASTKIVLLTLRGRFEFCIEPGNQVFSEELDEKTIQRLLQTHMRKQREIELRRSQVMKIEKKRVKRPNEIVLNDVLKKRNR